MSDPTPKLVRIFISSPSDVAEERRAAAELIEQELAKREAFRRPLKLDVFRYDDPHSDTPFQADRSAQASVDQRLQSADAEIVVAVLWARMGTPVRDPSNPDKILYRSGTEQEIKEALKAGREVLVYFRLGERPLPSNNADVPEVLAQRDQVRAFREELKPRGVNDFKDVEDFKRKLEQHLDQRLTRIRDASLAPARQVPAAPEPTWAGDPYPGLRSFEPDEAAIFFGRKDEAGELVRWVAEEGRRFVAVVGASGSGKSSLVKAGLVPALREWPSAIVRLTDAGGDPFRALAIRLEPHLSPSRRAALRADPANSLAKSDWIDDPLWDEPASSCLVIVIDQFEELQTAVAENLRSSFAALLKDLTAHHRVRIIVSLRADFLGALSRDETLARLFSGNTFVLHPPGAAALRAIIREPARLVGVAVEDQLVDELAEAAHQEPGALPLLAFALARLYASREGQRLARPAVAGLTTLGAILSGYTKEIEDALPTEQREVLPQLFRHLVRVEDGGLRVAKRRCRPADIGDDTTLIALRDRLIEARLLTALDDPAEGVELAHEVLLQAWPGVYAWVGAYSAHLVVRDEIEALWRRWKHESGKPNFLLPAGRLLQEAMRLKSEQPGLLPPGMAEYIDASGGAMGMAARLVAELSEDDAQSRRLAAVELSARANELRNADLAPVRGKLMEAVKNDNDTEVRVAAVAALAALGYGNGASAVELSEMFAQLLGLDEVWWSVSVAAISALGELPQLAPGLYAQLKGATNHRYLCQEAIKTIGKTCAAEPEAADFVGGFLLHQDKAESNRAVEASFAAVQALEAIASAGGEAARANSERAIQLLVEALAKGTANTAADAASALGRLQTPAATDPLIAAIDRPEAKVGSAAALALARHGAPVPSRLIPRLLSELGASSDLDDSRGYGSVVTAHAMALSQVDFVDRETVERVLQLSFDGTAGQQAAAVIALNGFKEKSVEASAARLLIAADKDIPDRVRHYLADVHDRPEFEAQLGRLRMLRTESGDVSSLLDAAIREYLAILDGSLPQLTSP